MLHRGAPRQADAKLLQCANETLEAAIAERRIAEDVLERGASPWRSRPSATMRPSRRPPPQAPSRSSPSGMRRGSDVEEKGAGEVTSPAQHAPEEAAIKEAGSLGTQNIRGLQTAPHRRPPTTLHCMIAVCMGGPATTAAPKRQPLTTMHRALAARSGGPAGTSCGCGRSRTVGCRPRCTVC